MRAMLYPFLFVSALLFGRISVAQGTPMLWPQSLGASPAIFPDEEAEKQCLLLPWQYPPAIPFSSTSPTLSDLESSVNEGAGSPRAVPSWEQWKPQRLFLHDEQNEETTTLCPTAFLPPRPVEPAPPLQYSATAFRSYSEIYYKQLTHSEAFSLDRETPQIGNEAALRIVDRLSSAPLLPTEMYQDVIGTPYFTHLVQPFDEGVQHSCKMGNAPDLVRWTQMAMARICQLSVPPDIPAEGILYPLKLCAMQNGYAGWIDHLLLMGPKENWPALPADMTDDRLDYGLTLYRAVKTSTIFAKAKDLPGRKPFWYYLTLTLLRPPPSPSAYRALEALRRKQMQLLRLALEYEYDEAAVRLVTAGALRKAYDAGDESPIHMVLQRSAVFPSSEEEEDQSRLRLLQHIIVEGTEASVLVGYEETLVTRALQNADVATIELLLCRLRDNAVFREGALYLGAIEHPQVATIHAMLHRLGVPIASDLALIHKTLAEKEVSVGQLRSFVEHLVAMHRVSTLLSLLCLAWEAGQMTLWEGILRLPGIDRMLEPYHRLLFPLYYDEVGLLS